MVRPDTVKLTNVVVTGFVESCNLVRESKISSRFRAEWEVSSEELFFCKLVFESDAQEFSFRGAKSKNISSHHCVVLKLQLEEQF